MFINVPMLEDNFQRTENLPTIDNSSLNKEGRNPFGIYSRISHDKTCDKFEFREDKHQGYAGT